MITEYDIKKIAKTRWRSIVKRCFNLGISPANYNDVEDLLLENYRYGFRCGYCLRELKLYTSYPSPSAPRIDHKIALSNGGTNNKENLMVVCHCCNINKGTMPLELFMAELYAIIESKPELMEKIFESKMKANLKNKLCREEHEKRYREAEE